MHWNSLLENIVEFNLVLLHEPRPVIEADAKSNVVHALGHAERQASIERLEDVASERARQRLPEDIAQLFFQGQRCYRPLVVQRG